MTIKSQIEEIFKEPVKENDIEAIALTSKNGIPIASYVEKKDEHESFSTLSATILGASEVIFSALEKKQPVDIIIRSDESILFIQENSSDSVLSMMGKSEDEERLIEIMDDISKKLKEIREGSLEIEVKK